MLRMPACKIQAQAHHYIFVHANGKGTVHADLTNNVVVVENHADLPYILHCYAQ